MNHEITPNLTEDELTTLRMDSEDRLATERLTPRETTNIQKRLAYISFELSMKAQDGTAA